MGRLDLGPVFLSELRRISRHWWSYALRSLLVLAVLLALGGVTEIGVRRLDLAQVSEVAKVGEWFFETIAAVQLSLILLAAPAATAGAFCTEMARGHVLLMLVSGITSTQIVFGTLGARLLHLMGIVACVVPVLCAASSLGGVPPQALVRLEVVTVGTAVLGCSLALAVSVFSRRLHETLMATYSLLAGWVMGYGILFMIRTTPAGRLVPGGWTTWFLDVNPFWLTLEPIFSPSTCTPATEWSFLASTSALSLGIASVAAWRISSAALAGFSPLRRPWLAHSSLFCSIFSLDSCPVFWRECRSAHSSFWFRLLWGVYVVGALVFTTMAVVECTTAGIARTVWPRPFNGFQAAVGLGLLSILAPATLAEERSRGSLDVLLSTPLSTPCLVLSKWFACYRLVPFLALLPAAVAAVHVPSFERWPGVLLVGGIVLAEGAAVTSLGLALATWVSRVDRALILSAGALVLITVGWIPFALLFFGERSLGIGVAMASPLFAVVQLTVDLATASTTDWALHANWGLRWILISIMVALVLLLATIATFDRCLGRITLRAAAASRFHLAN
jgi:ABC-type transport system involved in multi-copper enzyme maturation permease subunit